MVKLILQNSTCEVQTDSKELLVDISEQLTYINKSVDFAYAKTLGQVSRYNKMIARETNENIVAKYKSMLRKLLFNIDQLEATRRVKLMKGKEFPAGLLPRVMDYLDGRGIYWELDDQRKSDVPKVNLKLLRPIPELRYYQKEAVEKALESERGVLEMATGAGKTLIVAKLLSELQVKSLVITPSLDITQGVYETMVNFFGEKQVSMLDGKKPKFSIVNIVNIQTLVKMDPKLFSDINCMLTDEFHHCLTSDVKLATDRGRLSIKYIVDNKLDCKVLSINKETGSFEYKKILNHFSYPAPQKLIRLTYQNPNGKTKTLKCTPNHNIWTTNRGYIEASQLTLDDDVVISNGYFCKICGKECKTPNSLSMCVTRHGWTPEDKKEQGARMSRHSNHNNPNARKLNSESKLGDKNVSKRPEIKARQKISQKAWWARMNKEERDWRISKFVNAPIHGLRKGPTSLEDRIIALQIPNLEFTGDGSSWVDSEGRAMNPDFSYKSDGRTRKVVEVGDDEYWHNADDIKERIRLMAVVGIQCLYFTSSYMKMMEDEDLRNQIMEFIYG